MIIATDKSCINTAALGHLGSQLDIVAAPPEIMAGLSFAQSLALVHLVHLFTPPLVAVVLLTALARFPSLAVPTWASILVPLVSIPTFFLGRARLRYWRNTRRAAQLGAQLPPRWEGKLPGNWDVVMLADDSYTKGFLSELSLRFRSRCNSRADIGCVVIR